MKVYFIKYTCITKCIHCFTINKYTKSFLITKPTTDNWSKPANHRHQPGCHHSELYLGRSKESNNQGTKLQVKRTVKNYSFCHEKKETGSLVALKANFWYSEEVNENLI